jgi:hypothetical protein
MSHLTTKNQIALDSYSVAIKKKKLKADNMYMYTIYIYIMQHKNNQDRDVYLRMHCTIFHAKYGKITEFNSLILLLF